MEAIEASQHMQKEQQKTYVFGEEVSDIYNTLNGEESGHGKEFKSTEPVTKIQLLA